MFQNHWKNLHLSAIQLQDKLEAIPVKDKIIIMGDIKARMGNEVLDGVKERFNANILNDLGELLIEWCRHTIN